MFNYRTRTISICLAFGLLLTISSPEIFADGNRDDGIAYFEKHIRPIFVQHCYQCHSQEADEVGGGLLLDSEQGWLSGGDSGASIVPKDVGASLLIEAIRYENPDLQMPPISPLQPEVVARVEAWVSMGAPAPEKIDIVTGDNPSDPIAGKSHWAFRSLSQSHLPKVKNRRWASTAIDRFILAKLESEGLRPVGDADRRDLARRLSFQIIGMPPTEIELATFLGDRSPDSVAKYIDRLLASPRFGERWGRHWLDLARYADSNGLDENFLFREAWRYRNWVIDRLNEDMPFDRFLMEQIAGDLLPFDTIDQRDRQRIGAGFLVLGPKVLLGNNEKNQRMEVADEQLDTIGKAIFGQTLGCARCHDHKFDPIPTADYYSLAGIFASTSVMETRFMLNEQRGMERLVGLGADGDAMDEAYEAYWRTAPNLRKSKVKAEAARNALNKKTAEELQKLIDAEPESFAERAKDSSLPIEARVAAQAELIAEFDAKLKPAPNIPPRAMIPVDVETPSDEAIRLAGEFDRPGDVVPRGFLRVLLDESSASIPSNTSGRLQFATWLTDENSRARDLVARVQVNRIWHHMFGVGLVRTVDNFGRTGEAPTHPELLDYLASSYIDSGWSLKALVREIALSHTFALSSQYDEDNYASDPDNRLLWRAHRRRLDPESWRDAMLHVAGQLDVTPMASTVSYLGDQATAVGANKVRRRTDFPCRSVYLPVIRNDLPELFQVFDFADPHVTTGDRPSTTVPTQGLFMLNDDLVLQASEAFAKRVLNGDDFRSEIDDRIDRIYQLALNDGPTLSEKDVMRRFIQETEERLLLEDDSDPEFRALAMACQALLMSTRFQYLE